MGATLDHSNTDDGHRRLSFEAAENKDLASAKYTMEEVTEVTAHHHHHHHRAVKCAPHKSAVCD